MFTIGCDPEVFVTKRGKPHSAYGILQGTKASPFKTPTGAYQVDGMAAEFNTSPVGLPATNSLRNFEVWNDYINQQIKAIREALPTGCSIRIEPVMEFGKEFLDAQPEAAKELGCDPDFDAYTLRANPKPDGEKTFRTAAGHIHIGWGDDIPVDNKEHIEICAGFVKMLDATVGMLMTYVDREPLRRELYGKAGAFRPKPYGVEYRTPSNVWIANRDLRTAIWLLVNEAIQYQRRSTDPKAVSLGYDPQEIINTGDHEKALACLQNIFKSAHRRISWSQYRQPAYLTRIIKATERKYGNGN